MQAAAAVRCGAFGVEFGRVAIGSPQPPVEKVPSSRIGPSGPAAYSPPLGGGLLLSVAGPSARLRACLAIGIDLAEIGGPQPLVEKLPSSRIGRAATGSPQPPTVPRWLVANSTSETSAARSRPLAEGCNSRPVGPLVQPVRSAAGLSLVEINHAAVGGPQLLFVRNVWRRVRSRSDQWAAAAGSGESALQPDRSVRTGSPQPPSGGGLHPHAARCKPIRSGLSRVGGRSARTERGSSLPVAEARSSYPNLRALCRLLPEPE